MNSKESIPEYFYENGYREIFRNVTIHDSLRIALSCSSYFILTKICLADFSNSGG